MCLSTVICQIWGRKCRGRFKFVVLAVVLYEPQLGWQLKYHRHYLRQGLTNVSIGHTIVNVELLMITYRVGQK